jgi:hypothetical protein
MGYLSCSAVLICAADEEDILAHESFESGNDVCWQQCTNDVAQMRNVVYIWQSCCYKCILGVWFGEDFGLASWNLLDFEGIDRLELFLGESDFNRVFLFLFRGQKPERRL